MNRRKQVGQPKDVGFQFGIRKTIPVSTEKIWDFLFSENGITGFIRIFKPNSHIRLNWKPKSWGNMLTVQI